MTVVTVTSNNNSVFFPSWTHSSILYEKSNPVLKMWIDCFRLSENMWLTDSVVSLYILLSNISCSVCLFTYHISVPVCYGLTVLLKLRTITLWFFLVRKVQVSFYCDDLIACISLSWQLFCLKTAAWTELYIENSLLTTTCSVNVHGHGGCRTRSFFMFTE